MPVGWFPDPTPSAVVAPGWGETPPAQVDPLVEVGWWALVALDASNSYAPAYESMQFGLIRTMAMWQAASASQSLVLQKIAALQLSHTATASQTATMQKVIGMALANVSPAAQALGLVKVIQLAMDASGAPAAEALSLTRVGVLNIASTAPAFTALELQKIAMLAYTSSAPAAQALTAMKIAIVSLATAPAPASTTLGLGYPPTAETTTSYTTGGAAYTYTIPRWADALDVIIVSSGAGGSGGSFSGNGAGGLPGQWLSATWVRGVDIPFSALTATGVVGKHPSTACTAAVAGGPSLSQAARSGTVGITNPRGQSPGDHTRNGKTYTGGAAQGALGNQGYAPGGGGAGGGWNGPGGAGAPGAVWYRAYQL